MFGRYILTFETKRRRKFQRQAWTINVSNTKKDKFGLETLRQLGGRNRARQGKTRVKGTNGAKEEGQHKGGNGVGFEKGEWGRKKRDCCCLPIILLQ